jgi:hypothetical protein
VPVNPDRGFYRLPEDILKGLPVRLRISDCRS